MQLPDKHHLYHDVLLQVLDSDSGGIDVAKYGMDTAKNHDTLLQSTLNHAEPKDSKFAAVQAVWMFVEASLNRTAQNGCYQ